MEKKYSEKSIGFNHSGPREILEWALKEFWPDIAMSTGFGASGMVLIHMISTINPKMKIIFLNTGFHFKETLEFKEKVIQKYGVNIIEYQALISKEELFKTISPHPYHDDPDRCCHMNKVEPMQRAIKGLRAWISALRRDQSPTRVNTHILEEYEGGLIKINPLANWTKKEVWNYLYQHKVPYHPLHDQGYPSIGCEPCTQSVGEGSHERSGRWVGKGKLECGIHTFLKKVDPEGENENQKSKVKNQN
ncbi:MAG: phosphoadenylyl-sulfate reductase [Chlamydiae bacterium]|nr:phosphoadenylyl-sulfate reductase [Chlamydiota bacterium]MBI3277920.1 phosphoadenylyl-sulfate reductase [Chlamydiota bacterium]